MYTLVCFSGPPHKITYFLEEMKIFIFGKNLYAAAAAMHAAAKGHLSRPRRLAASLDLPRYLSTLDTYNLIKYF